MESYRKKVIEASYYLSKKTKIKPETGILMGTGLGNLADSMKITESFPYKDIPHFPVSTVESHKGRLLFGKIGKKSVMAMQGRFHLYEGYSPLEVAFPIRVMQNMGIKTLIVSNAAGGLLQKFSPGDIMIIRDHINMTGENPLVGPNIDEWGIRFPDMSRVYDPGLIALAKKEGEKAKIPVKAGVYAGLKGPSLETPAEVRFLQAIGGHAVGFSTVQEVITAVHANMKILGLSIITNVHNPDDPSPSTVEEIIEVAANAAPRLEKIIKKVIASIRG